MPTLGKISLQNLEGVHPQLDNLARYAITSSPIDFRVTDGLRTLEEQRYLVEIGASRTLDSRHLTGDAIDIVPWILDKPRWEWSLIYTLAEHIRSCAQHLEIRIRWGALWDVGSFTSTTQPCKTLVEQYILRQRARGRKVCLDGPHFELPKKTEK